MRGVVLDNNHETPRRLQELARHKMITRLYADILHDIAVCELEGWDKTEYIKMLQSALNRFQIKEDKP